MPAPPYSPLEPDCFYHIYNRANGNDNIFRERTNYEYFLKLYSTYIPAIADTFAFCLMPNHFHFAVRLKSEKKLVNYYRRKNKVIEEINTAQSLIECNSQQYSNLFNAYAQAFNKKYARRGGLFVSNFKRKKVTSINYLLNLIHYIHNNPVHHGFVKQIDEWRYSSYHAFLSDRKTLLARKDVLEFFGGKNAFQEFHMREFDTEFLQTVEFE